MEEQATGLAAFSEWFSAQVTRIFLPILKPVFNPIDSVLSPIGEPVWTFCAVGLFVAAMVWVFLLKKQYVNVDAPGKSPLFDLRLWTVVSMMPHVVVYLYFGLRAYNKVNGE